MKNKISLKTLFVLLATGLVSACMGMEQTGPSEMEVPDIKTFEVKDDSSLVFELSSNVDKQVAGRVAECGFYYGKEKSMVGAAQIECKMLGNSFAADLTLREYDETFYVCSYISNGSKDVEICSQSKTISVKKFDEYVDFSTPTLISYDIESKTAIVSLSFDVRNGVDVTKAGLCYGISGTLSMSDAHIDDEDFSDGAINVELSNLEVGTTYYVRPYLYDGDNLAYGEVYDLYATSVPKVNLGEISDITSESATVSFSVLDDCGMPVKSRGLVYVKGKNEPSLSTGNIIVDGTIGNGMAILAGLVPNSVYTVRAYAENEKGIAYSGVKRMFTTKLISPSVSVSLGASPTSVIFNGEVSAGGDETPSEVGFYYSQSDKLDKAYSVKVPSVLSNSSFAAEVSGLMHLSEYFVQAYAVNSAGEALSEIVSFSTGAQLSLPELGTVYMSNCTSSSVVLRSSVINDGGDPPYEVGFYYSKSIDFNPLTAIKTVAVLEGTAISAEITGLEPATEYQVCAYAINGEGESLGPVTSFTTLPFGETANSYIITSAGSYCFPAVKGNSNQSVGSVKSADVLWESFGTSTTTHVGDLIKTVSYNNGIIYFETPEKFSEGNAVIAARSSSGKILWSWHIWLTDQPGECVYANGAGVMMDRNLGATDAISGSVGALGLLYQWGRKDPFLGSASISKSEEPSHTMTWPSPVSSTSSRGTIAYSIENPMTFITGNDTNHDWYYGTDSTSTDNTRWRASKTIYDPCPPGWRVPDGGDNGVWVKAGFEAQTYDEMNEGMSFGSGISSPSTWYPAASYRASSSGELAGKISVIINSITSYYWSVTPSSANARCLSLRDGITILLKKVDPSATIFRANGASVRCIRE